MQVLFTLQRRGKIAKCVKLEIREDSLLFISILVFSTDEFEHFLCGYLLVEMRKIGQFLLYVTNMFAEKLVC